MAEFRHLMDFWGADVYERDGWQVVELKPLADGYADPSGLAEPVWAIVAHWRPPRMVLDMRHVRFMSSSLMGVLVQLHKRLAMAGGEFHIACLSPPAVEALHACQLHAILPLFDSVDAAAGYAN